MLLAIFSIFRSYSDTGENRFTLHPSLIEYSDKENELSIGFGLIDSSGDKTKTWEVFPVRILLRSGNRRFYLGLNGLSLLTQSGINIEKDMVINKVYRGDVVSFGGDVTISSTVQGSVWVFSGDVKLLNGANIQGDVIALGGNISQSGYVVIRGNKNAIPQFSIPFIGLLTSARSAATLHFMLEIFGIVLFLLILFVVLFFRQQNLLDTASSVLSSWRGVLLYLLIALILIPVLIFFLYISVIGVMVIPVIFLGIIIAAYYGFMASMIRFGKVFFNKGNDSLPQTLLCGLIGLLVLKGPILLGIFLSLLESDIIGIIGSFLSYIGSIAFYVVFLYGFGATLMQLRQR